MTLTKEALDTAKAARDVIEELSQEFFERRSHIEAMVTALFAGQHTFGLGPPGTGKSMLNRALCNRITGARFFDILLDRQLAMDSFFGPIDIIEFRNTGNWHRRVDGYAATANLAFLDEVGKAGPGVTNPMLTWLEERLFHNNSTPMQTPLLTAMGASNEELEMPDQAALWDRFTMRLIFEPIQEPGNFAALLSTPVQIGTAQATTMKLEAVEKAVREWVPKITVPPAIIDSLRELRTELQSDQINPSDRRWKKGVGILRARAFWEGSDTVDDDHIAILRHVLWDVVEQIPEVERKVLARTSPLTREVLEFEGQLEEIEAGVDDRKGQSVEARAKYGGEAKHKVDSIHKRVTDLKEKANRQGRTTSRLEQVESQIKKVKVRIYVDCLNVPEDRAKDMG